MTLIEDTPCPYMRSDCGYRCSGIFWYVVCKVCIHGPKGPHTPTTAAHAAQDQRLRDPPGTARHTQRRTRGAGRGKQGRHDTRYRPQLPEPAARAAHTRPGHCTCQGSSGALRHAPAPRVGSLCASPRGPTGDKPVARARQRRRPRQPRIGGATRWVSACSHG